MEQGDDDSGRFLTAEIVRGKERDQYGDEDRRNPIEEPPPFRMPLIHESFPLGAVALGELGNRDSTRRTKKRSAMLETWSSSQTSSPPLRNSSRQARVASCQLPIFVPYA